MCRYLDDATQTGELIFVWSFDAAPDDSFPNAIRASIDSILELPSQKPLWKRIICGNRACLHQASTLLDNDNHMPCLRIETLLVQDLCNTSPADKWCRQHIRTKLLSAHLFEGQLQPLMQLLALYKYGGVVIFPGVILTPNFLHGGTSKNSINIARITNTTNQDENKEMPFNLYDHSFVGIAAAAKSSSIEAIIKRFQQEYLKQASSSVWPVSVDWVALLEKLNYIAVHTQLTQSPYLPSHIQRGLRYATLSYDLRRFDLSKSGSADGYQGMNLGDEMQGLAGIQFLPYIDTFVERESFNINFKTTNISHAVPEDKLEPTIVYLNGWYGAGTRVWPPPPHLSPVMLSIHADQGASRKFKETAKQLSRFWPIGFRDTETNNYMKKRGAPSFVSNCMTTTLMRPCSSTDVAAAGSKIKPLIIVDVNDDEVSGIVPAKHLAMAQRMSVISRNQTINGDKIHRYLSAFDNLFALSCEARAVVTRRLHAALPAAASDIPVIWPRTSTNLPGGESWMSKRVSDYFELFHHISNSSSGENNIENETAATFNWEMPPPNPLAEKRLKMRHRLRILSYCHHESIGDAAVKFGTVPHCWHDWDNDNKKEAVDYSYSVSDKETLPDIRIAFLVDTKLLMSDSLVASFINSLVRNTERPVGIHLFAVGLSKPRQCVLHFLAKNQIQYPSFVRIHTILEYSELSTMNQGLLKELALTMLLDSSAGISRVLWANLPGVFVGPLDGMWDAVQANASQCLDSSPSWDHSSIWNLDAQWSVRCRRDNSGESSFLVISPGQMDTRQTVELQNKAPPPLLWIPGNPADGGTHGVVEKYHLGTSEALGLGWQIPCTSNNVKEGKNISGIKPPTDLQRSNKMNEQAKELLLKDNGGIRTRDAGSAQQSSQNKTEDKSLLEQINATAPFTYVFLLSGCHEKMSSYRGYLYNILIACKILRDHQTRGDIVVLIQMFYSSLQDRLPVHEEEWIRQVGGKPAYLPKPGKAERFKDTMLTKFEILGLTDYERVIFLDADLIPLCSLDYLYDLSRAGKLKPNVVVSDVGVPVQGGTFMVAPKEGDLEFTRKKIDSARGKKFDSINGWHPITPPDYWSSFRYPKRHKNDWKFYGAFTDGGLIFYWTKYVQRNVSIIVNNSVENWSEGSNGTMALESKEWGLFRKYRCFPKRRHLKTSFFVTSARGHFYAKYDFLSQLIHFVGYTKPWLLTHIPDECNMTTHHSRYDCTSGEQYWFHELRALNRELKMGLTFTQWSNEMFLNPHGEILLSGNMDTL